VGAYFVACSFRNVNDNFEWAYAGVYDPNVDSGRRCFGMNWLGCFVGGIYCGVLGVISTSSACRARDLAISFVLELEFIFEQGLMDLPLVNGKV
jgi:ABC-type branched-subunit amino acid transport system permease subunit